MGPGETGVADRGAITRQAVTGSDRRIVTARAQAERGSRIFLMIRPRALIAGMGVQDAYEVPRGRLPDAGPSPFDME